VAEAVLRRTAGRLLWPGQHQALWQLHRAGGRVQMRLLLFKKKLQEHDTTDHIALVRTGLAPTASTQQKPVCQQAQRVTLSDMSVLRDPERLPALTHLPPTIQDWPTKHRNKSEGVTNTYIHMHTYTAQGCQRGRAALPAYPGPRPPEQPHQGGPQTRARAAG
jgi:hypothetical protein